MENWLLARGFRYAGVHCGIKPDPNRLDLALVVSERPGTFLPHEEKGIKPLDTRMP